MSAAGPRLGRVTGIGVFEFSAVLWVQEGDAQWHFITLPGEISDDIRQLTGSTQRGFGSVRVSVTVGSTTWQTSVFPDSKTGCYVLPTKKPVRLAEDLVAGATVAVQLEVLDL